jgi:peptidoglycan/LPS O-acetylase OafA/YrhL
MPSLEIKVPALPRGRVEVLDELRGLAIVLVILYHIGGVLVWQNFLHGDAGVDIFVILSGVGLTLGAREEGPWTFLRRRFARIFPAYWIVLSLFLWADIHFLQLRYTALDIGAHYLGIQAWFGDVIGLGINDSFWFVTLIVSVYLLYALLKPILGRPDRVVFWGGVISAAVAYAYFLTGQSGCYGHVGLRLPGFFVGLLLGQLLRDGSLKIPVSTFFAAGLLVGVYVPYTHGIVFYSELTALAIGAGYVFLWKVKAPAESVSSLGKYLRFFGKYSLEIFLIHQPLIGAYNYYLHARWLDEANPPAWSLAIGVGIGLVITLFAAVELQALLGRFARPGVRRDRAISTG